MVDPALTEISSSDRSLAIRAMRMLVDGLGDAAIKEVSATDISKLLTFMSGMILEAASPLMTDGDAIRVGNQLGEHIAFHASQIRRHNERTGHQIIHQVLMDQISFEHQDGLAARLYN